MVEKRDWDFAGFEIQNAVRDELSTRKPFNSEEANLIQHLSWDIVWRWKEKAWENREPTFATMFEENRKNAIAAIVAIIELVRKVGAGEPLLAEEDSWIVAQLKKNEPC